jgi:hypothetical protein
VTEGYAILSSDFHGSLAKGRWQVQLNEAPVGGRLGHVRVAKLRGNCAKAVKGLDAGFRKNARPRILLTRMQRNDTLG